MPCIDPRLRELMVLRVAWRTRSRYEWVQHVRLAKQLGVTTEQIETIAGLCAGDPWTPLEADVLAATDQLLDRYVVDDGTWARLAARLDQRQLVELVFVVGSYACLAMAFNSFGIELDPELQDVDAPPIPDAKR
jgi:4-carboxymuconolactone decarboxylase